MCGDRSACMYCRRRRRLARRGPARGSSWPSCRSPPASTSTSSSPGCRNVWGNVWRKERGKRSRTEFLVTRIMLKVGWWKQWGCELKRGKQLFHNYVSIMNNWYFIECLRGDPHRLLYLSVRPSIRYNSLHDLQRRRLTLLWALVFLFQSCTVNSDLWPVPS